MTVTLDKTVMLATFIGSLLFGIFTTLFATTTYILVSKRRKMQPVNKRVLTASVLMYVVALMHVAVAMQWTINGFFESRDTLGGPIAYFLKSSDALYLFKMALYVSQTIIGDAFLIYRLYVVWNRDKRLLVPVLCLLAGSIASGAGALSTSATTTATPSVFDGSARRRWITSFFTLTLFTNFSCTVLIAGKIWWAEHRSVGAVRTRNLSPVAIIVVESGAIYSAALISLLGTYLGGSWVQYILIDMVVQIIGIVFSFIIVRIGLGTTADNTTWRSRVTMKGARSPGSHNLLTNVPLTPVTVKISMSRNIRDDDGNTLNGNGSFTNMDGSEVKSGGKV